VRRVEFTGQIPRSPSGKILRRVLADRERAAREGDLTGTVVLISAGGRGLGRLLAGTLGGARAAVGLLARSGDELAETAAEIELAGGTAAGFGVAGAAAIAVVGFRNTRNATVRTIAAGAANTMANLAAAREDRLRGWELPCR
jgi:NAD(P)-dependent dehydrogenase (short-subunit alcohol dehydrogenase family)